MTWRGSAPGSAPQGVQGEPALPGEPGQRADRAERTARPKLTGRAALLAVVICAIALSLAYPVREYIAEHRQISQLEELNSQLAGQISRLRALHRTDTSPTYIEQQARDQLHMCLPAETCYVVINPHRSTAAGGAAQRGTPWYVLLWKSVQAADKRQGKLR